jgi:ribose/xylose/arabinose/galactoside ABC-type transport system permease subunit
MTAGAVLPVLALLFMLAGIIWMRPVVFSFFGMSLLLSFGMPLILVTMAQLCVITAGDIDLGIGPFVSLVTCVAATTLSHSPLLGVGALLLCVLAYMLLGALIQLRQLPSIIATLGASFVWWGVALTILPQPGGIVPEWLPSLTRGEIFPYIPAPILLAIIVAIVGHLIFMVSSFGSILRGFGANPVAVERAGWSPLGIRVALYGMAGTFGVLAGLTMSGLSTTGDANVGTQYTLLSVAAVIIGGGEFSGGVVSPIGAVAGALIMLLTGSLLSFADVSPNWQLSVQGVLLISVLAIKRWRHKS